MHYHDLDNQLMESLLERHIYSRGLGKGINMRLSYPHKDIMSEGCCLRHRWCGLGFCLDDRVYFFQGISHPNIRWYETSVVGWQCLDHISGMVEWNGFFYPRSIFPLLLSLVAFESAIGFVFSSSTSLLRLGACALLIACALLEACALCCALKIFRSRNETPSFVRKFCATIFCNRHFLIPVHARRVP